MSAVVDEQAKRRVLEGGVIVGQGAQWHEGAAAVVDDSKLEERMHESS